MGGAELSDETSRMPCRARRQLLPLEQNDIGEAAKRQVIGEAAADDAAANDHDLG